MASPTGPIIDASGISAPTYAEVLEYLQQQFRSIYGADAYLGNDSQDGQFLGVLALAISDANAATIAVYNSFSPLTAQKNGLSSNVKINGISRGVSTSSQVDLLLVGQAGTQITQGLAKDQNGRQWALPPVVVISPSGDITVTATCTQSGDISATPGQVNEIATPVRGWQSVTNPAAAISGAPVESDAALRQRQQISVALPSRTVLEGTTGAVADLVGVTRVATYENDTNVTDANGIPAHSISLVVEGGSVPAIAQAIATKKTPGTGTYGSIGQMVPDVYGNPITILFFRPAYVVIDVAITVKPLPGYSSSQASTIKQAVSDYVNSVPIGGGPSGTVEWADAITAANSVPNSSTFKITSLTLSGPGGPGTPDVPLAFNAAAECAPANVVITVP